MRISSVFLTTLFVFNITACSNVSAHTKARGFVQDAQGRTLVYRAQPSWWGLPGSASLTGLGAFITYYAWYEQNPQVDLEGYFTLRDIWPDLHDVLARIRLNIPFENLTGKPARAIKCVLGAGVTASGATLLSSWINNYWNLSKPLIIIDHQGLQYEGKNFIPWKDIKSVHIEYDMTVHWYKGKIKREPCLEIVDVYGRLLIHESDIAITVDALSDLIKQYQKKW